MRTTCASRRSFELHSSDDNVHEMVPQQSNSWNPPGVNNGHEQGGAANQSEASGSARSSGTEYLSAGSSQQHPFSPKGLGFRVEG